jgi:transposase-like protein
VPVAELIRQVGITEQTLYRWKKQYKGLETDQVRQFTVQFTELTKQNPHRPAARRDVVENYLRSNQ